MKQKLHPMQTLSPLDIGARSAALKLYRLAHRPKAKHVQIPVAQVPWRDRRFMLRAQKILVGLGFRDISCFRIQTGEGEGERGLRYLLLTTEDGAICATVAVIRAKLEVSPLKRLLLILSGGAPKPREFLEFTTTLSSGAVIDTSNSGQSNPLTSPPGFDHVRMPAKTPVAVQLAAHRRRVNAHLACGPGASVVCIVDLDSYVRANDADRERRNRYRQSIGYVTEDELRALANDNYVNVRDSVMAELARLQNEGGSITGKSTEPHK
jgi:hypothetical protein